jgi:hypothetical protein
MVLDVSIEKMVFGGAHLGRVEDEQNTRKQLSLADTCQEDYLTHLIKGNIKRRDTHARHVRLDMQPSILPRRRAIWARCEVATLWSYQLQANCVFQFRLTHERHSHAVPWWYM